jgi:hypothetical protein
MLTTMAASLGSVYRPAWPWMPPAISMSRILAITISARSPPLALLPPWAGSTEGFADDEVDDGISTAQFKTPWWIAVDTSGNVYVADTNNHVIRKITSAGLVTTLAGSAGSPGSTDDTGNAARFRNPHGIAMGSDGNLYVADQGNNTIRKVTPAGVVETLAGLAGNVGSADGVGSAARFKTPTGISADDSGNLYVADLDNNLIRKITSAVLSLLLLAPLALPA